MAPLGTTVKRALAFLASQFRNADAVAGKMMLRA